MSTTSFLSIDLKNQFATFGFHVFRYRAKCFIMFLCFLFLIAFVFFWHFEFIACSNYFFCFISVFFIVLQINDLRIGWLFVLSVVGMFRS